MGELKTFMEKRILDPSALLGAIFYAAVFITAAWALGRLLKSIVRRAMGRDHYGP
jgi:uncharacterized membrane protein